MTYGAILCDPPWLFRTYDGKRSVAGRAAEQPYATLSPSALAALPVGEWAAKDCALFMWVVDAHLAQAIKLGEAWGFTFKTVAFLWDKNSIGMGYWTRKQCELCLLFTRGKPKRKSKSVRQIIRAKRREHSRKPDEIYGRIESLVDGPYLEMFARQSWPGWDSWGDEVEKFKAVA